MTEPNIIELARSLERIAARLEKVNEPCPFSAEEIAQLKRAGELVQWFETAGWMGKRLLAFLAAIILLMSQGQSIWDKFKEFMGAGQ